MTSKDNLLAFLNRDSGIDDGLPPVENWHPENCGSMDLVIRSNGEWWHEGSPIGRKKLFQLFSTVLRKDDDQYFLVTPVEKIAITVEWQPFVIVDFDRVEQNGTTSYIFTDNCGNQVALKSLEQLQLFPFEGQQLPVVKIRRNLYASFTRSCYYRLVEAGETKTSGDSVTICIRSNGIEFVIGEYAENEQL